MSEKVAGQTKLETVSKLFCVEASKSNHEQKQPGYLKKNCQISVKDIIICCSYFILFELGLKASGLFKYVGHRQ